MEIVTENSVTPEGTTSINAKKVDAPHVYARFRKYCVVFRAEKDSFFAIFPAVKEQKCSGQFPRSGGLGSVMINAPFLLYPGTGTFTKDPHTAAHIAEGLYSKLNNILKIK